MTEEHNEWLRAHIENQPYFQSGEPEYTRDETQLDNDPVLRDVAFNRHSMNDGHHVSPYDEGLIQVGKDNLVVRLTQGIDEEQFKRTLARATKATTGWGIDEPDHPEDWQEMMRGGLQSALETQTVIFEVYGASRALTHQLVRSRRASFHQQSQRATWFGDRPNVRIPESVWRNDAARQAYIESVQKAWAAYQVACDEDISYQDARFILPEGTTNFIMCEYSIREFLAVYNYRACSMFMWEMVSCVREMGRLLAERHPFLKDYIKISCEKGKLCEECGGTGEVDFFRGTAKCEACDGKGSPTRKCTFQGWESVEGQCSFPWAKQDNRVFLPDPRNRIGKKDG